MNRPHLLAVWNPAYGRDAMEAHLRVLQQAVREHRAGRCGEDDVYVWWGKIRSSNRLGPLPHREEILAMEGELARDDPGPETHVYLTDFQSLYVAHLAEITTDDPRKDRAQRPRIPGYYTKDKLDCDFWFRLWDIRRLVANDLQTVAVELRKLKNRRHDRRPVSLYGGMVDLPLVVEAAEEHRFFDPEFREHYTGEKFWVEFDGERSGVGEMERELRENLFGDAAWQAFGPTTRLFLATAEKLWRDNAHDPAFDCGSVLVEYCKAMEVRCNWLLAQAMKGAPDAIRYDNVNGRSADLSGSQQFTLVELASAIAKEKARATFLSGRPENGGWFTGQLPAILEALAKLRGPAAHSEAPDRADVARWRQQLCGVGCEGHFVNLAKVKVKGR
jgi:hypothetical protein